MAEAVEAVDRERSKLEKRLRSVKTSTISSLSELTSELTQLQESIRRNGDGEEMSCEQNNLLLQSLELVRDGVGKLSGEHKDIHGSISKVGRAIDRNFTSDIHVCSQDNVLDSPEQASMLNEVVYEHFLRQGQMAVAKCLIEEAGVVVDQAHHSQYVQLNCILEACKARNLSPALSWASKHRDALEAHNSQLEFKLHRLQFLSLLQAGDLRAALDYSKNLALYSTSFRKEVQQLMGCFLYISRGLGQSPYAELLHSRLWEEVCDDFMHEACAIHGLALNSHLAACLSVGCQALPSLLQIKAVMQQRQCPDMWISMNELPIDIDPGLKFQYHAVFACPILRQQCTAENPPMRLTCGHVISKEAINRLVAGIRLKCPYCPVEMTSDEPRQIYF
ncbi:E3 ubiquitin-protein ligase RMND5A-like [Corticium candelabrum]|uniref:E3 ubiquitin-protein ligase RMND5A-like n=1 Tax=Corticium candelabrum TaxID=121492 RepID=UPI002E2541BC|nr:E3 ubiquitin-protein ligase RMND5A-like [Corticium candelabrum]